MQKVSPEMLALLRDLRKKVAIGFVGGSDLVKINEQLSVNGSNSKPAQRLMSFDLRFIVIRRRGF
jgi:hypothetical protein